MARKVFITKQVEEKTQDGMTVFPANRTLYADQLTYDAPVNKREGFKASSMNDVFEHYQPQVDDIELTAEDGSLVNEGFKFSQIKDFEDNQLIAQSKHMSEEKSKIDDFNAIIYQLERNKTLHKAMKDDKSRDNLKNALKALLAELENEN